MSNDDNAIARLGKMMCQMNQGLNGIEKYSIPVSGKPRLFCLSLNFRFSMADKVKRAQSFTQRAMQIFECLKRNLNMKDCKRTVKKNKKSETHSNWYDDVTGCFRECG